MSGKLIYIIAGETSGDQLGARLIEALTPMGNFTFRGVGGQAMESKGFKSLFPMDDLSLMGIVEIIPNISNVMKRIDQTVNDIAVRKPDIVITIDSPDFCKRVVKKARKRSLKIPFIHYVAPTVWAWREGRSKTMADLFDGLICLLPFEPPYFENHGLHAKFCGHPLIESISEEQFTRDPKEILILPGSRKSEVKRMGPVFHDVYKEMRQQFPKLNASIVALPHVRSEIEKIFEFTDVQYISPEDRYNAFKHAGFAFATSGTVGLELAVAGCPHIIAYKMNPITYWMVKKMVKTDYAHLANIIEGREIVPEFIQSDCKPEIILESLDKMPKQDFTSIREQLKGETPQKTPSQQAADFVIGYL